MVITTRAFASALMFQSCNEVDGHQFLEFGERLKLREVIVGSRNDVVKETLRGCLLAGGNSDTEIWKVKPSVRDFKMVRDEKFDAECLTSAQAAGRAT